jgi:hypothetical protein
MKATGTLDRGPSSLTLYFHSSQFAVPLRGLLSTAYCQLPTCCFYASPHIPRRGAPQAPQGPGSLEAAAAEGPATAKTESN